MRKQSSSPNKLMESLHLKPFADEGSRQAAAAADAAAAAAAAHAAGRSAFRGELTNKMATGRIEKTIKLQRDEAVHAAILRHQVRELSASMHCRHVCSPIGLHVIADGAVLLSTDAAARHGAQLTASQA